MHACALYFALVGLLFLVCVGIGAAFQHGLYAWRIRRASRSLIEMDRKRRDPLAGIFKDKEEPDA